MGLQSEKQYMKEIMSFLPEAKEKPARGEIQTQREKPRQTKKNEALFVT